MQGRKRTVKHVKTQRAKNMRTLSNFGKLDQINDLVEETLERVSNF